MQKQLLKPTPMAYKDFKMPKFLEDKLKKEYGADSKIPYKVMNSIGAMKGNKETKKGETMDMKHKLKMQSAAIKRSIK